MKTLTKLILVLAIILAGGVYYFWTDINTFYGLQSASDQITPPEEIPDQMEEVEQNVVTSTPLVQPRSDIKLDSKATLTVLGTINQTNLQREQNNLPKLQINTKLIAAAESKVNDMFELQYFEHESPSGNGPGDLARNAGYEYLLVGENLALGNYASGAVLVEAWMNSPGHRANILNNKYTEIGVAVRRGMYKGEMTWLAVQEFGRPAPDCPSVDNSLKVEFERNKELLSELEQELEERKQEMESTNPKRGAEYNQKVDEYNEMVNQHNSLVAETKDLVATYNAQIQNYNTCIQ